jgi:uncharacterized protein (TIGR03083 family)
MQTLSYPAMLTMIEDRSEALRAAAAQAGLAARVPGCPDWTVTDLIAHLGAVQLFWAAAVAAGEAAGPPADDAVGDTEPHGDLLSWSGDATGKLIRTLEDAGPDRMCWTWWESSGAPMTSGAVARHQVQEAAVHAFDAQQAAGHGLPLPPAIAADGVGEYLTVELPTNGPWPYEPATVIIETGPGGNWLIDLGPVGAQIILGVTDHGDAKPSVTVTADPGDMVLAFYRRDLIGELHVDGDAELVPQFLNWPNLD